MALDRSKFKAAPMAAMKKLDGELGQRRGFANFERIGYHSIEDGDNKFRIYPPHPDDKGHVFWYPKSSSFLSLEVELRDDKGDKTGETEIKRRPVFTSDVHGPKELAGKDLNKMYIDFAKKQFDEMFETEDEKKTANSILTDWKKGITPKLTWIMYADKYDNKGQKTLAFLEIGQATKKKMNELASEMDTGNDPIAVDPFTDPEDGIAVIINKTGEGLATTYKVDFESKKNGKFNVSLIPTPLSDEDLEKFMAFEPLSKRFKESFRRRDFELQKEGLMRFDQDNEFHFFEMPEFIEQVEELQELVFSVIPEDEKPQANEAKEPQEEAEPEKPKAPAASRRIVKETPKVEEPEETEEEEEEDPEPEEEPEVVKETPKAKDETPKTGMSKLDELKARLAASKGK